MDSAFHLGTRNFIIKSTQQDPMDIEGLLENRDATSVRQLSEWGMRMIEGQFPRIKNPLCMKQKGIGKSSCAFLYICIIFRLRKLVSIKF